MNDKSSNEASSGPPLNAKQSDIYVTIRGLEDITFEQIQQEVLLGAKFVRYPYCVSPILMTFRHSSDIFFIKPEKSAFLTGRGDCGRDAGTNPRWIRILDCLVRQKPGLEAGARKKSLNVCWGILRINHRSSQ